MPLTVLGVDSSLTGTGLARIHITARRPTDPLAVLTPDEVLVATVGNKKVKLKTRREYSRRITTVVDQVDAAMEGVDVIMMEELAYGAKGATAFVLTWIWGRIIDCAERRDIPIGFVNLSQIKKYATGNGAADKSQVVARMVRLFPEVDVSNDNEADALTAGLIACRASGYPCDHPTVAKEDVMNKLGGFERA